MTPVLQVEGLRHGYGGPPILDGVDLVLGKGEILGLVGGSGAGKSTLARCIAGLEEPHAGRIIVEGTERLALPPGRLQMVFQDPVGSLDPRQRVGRSIAEPLRVLGVPRDERASRVATLLRDVGLDPADAARWPHEFSGGQRQRIAIARALAPRPAIVLADEPVSALDVSIQAQILNLILDLRDSRGVSWLLITHDLRVVRHVADRIAVLDRGRIAEAGPTAQMLDAPRHAATRALLAAMLPEPGG